MKQFCLAVGLLAAVFSMGLNAQGLDSRAEVPFDFWLGHQLMPAGEYLIHYMGTSTVVIRGQDGTQSSAVFLGQRVSRLESHPQGTVEFTKYGNTCFLSKIWNAYDTDGVAVQKSSKEKELARHSISPRTTSIALMHK